MLIGAHGLIRTKKAEVQEYQLQTNYTSVSLV